MMSVLEVLFGFSNVNGKCLRNSSLELVDLLPPHDIIILFLGIVGFKKQIFLSPCHISCRLLYALTDQLTSSC